MVLFVQGLFYLKYDARKIQSKYYTTQTHTTLENTFSTLSSNSSVETLKALYSFTCFTLIVINIKCCNCLTSLEKNLGCCSSSCLTFCQKHRQSDERNLFYIKRISSIVFTIKI